MMGAASRRRRTIWLHLRAVALLPACTGSSSDTPDELGGAGGQAGAGGSGGSPGVQILHEGENRPYALAIDDGTLYWASAAGLRRAPLDGGGPAVTLASVDVDDLVLAGEWLFFHQSRTGVRSGVGRVHRDGGEPEWLSETPDTRSLVANETSLFWSTTGEDWNEGRLWRMNLDGSGLTELASGLISPRNLALAGAELHLVHGIGTGCVSTPERPCLDEGIFRLPTAGAPERIVSATVESGPEWRAGAIYWLSGTPSGSDVMSLPTGTSQPIVVHDSPYGGGALTSDAEALYWIGRGVRRMSFATGAVERLTSGLEGISSVVAHDGGLYATDSANGRILRIATDGSAYRPESEPITLPCPEPLGSAAELALTPRPEPNLELLGLELEPNNVVVSQATYDRLVSDVTAIRALEPTTALVTYLEWHDGRSLQLQWSNQAANAFADGQYTAWDCLNDAYTLVSVNAYDNTVDLKLAGIYNIPLIVERYRQLPGVTSVSSSSRSLDGPTICVSRASERYEYVFDDTGNYCPEPCMQHLAHHFTSDAPGQVTLVASWDSTTGAPVPEWFGSICEFTPQVGL